MHPRTLLADLAGERGKGPHTYETELAWREFYADVLWHQPRTAWQDLRPEMSRMRYSAPEDAIEAWKAGRTGYPVVDAGMRQLLAEGWMHNRVRMITASFLTKDLHVWWPVGARHFLEHLVDGDLASNNHGWQWVAGTGTDASPYFRVFNPVTQGRRFDPDGDYVRRWVPELAHVPGRRGARAVGRRGRPRPRLPRAHRRPRRGAARGAGPPRGDETLTRPQLSRPMPEPSPGHHVGSGAYVKVLARSSGDATVRATRCGAWAHASPRLDRTRGVLPKLAPVSTTTTWWSRCGAARLGRPGEGDLKTVPRLEETHVPHVPARCRRGPAAAAGPSIGTPVLWAATIAGVALLFVVDFVITRRPHEVSMREAVGWSAFYVAIPVAFGVWIWQQHGGDRGLEYYTGYLVEKSLSVDNLFVFLLLLTAFAVPRELQQRVLLIGVAGALVLRGVFIALGAQLIASLLVGLPPLRRRPARDGRQGAARRALARRPHGRHRVDPVRAAAASRHAGERGVCRDPAHRRRAGRRALTPLALVTVAILGTDVVFAIDSVPAVYGITGDPYLVFATNAFALLGLRALYFVVAGALGSLRHLGHGLAAILAFIGVKLVLHWAHGAGRPCPRCRPSRRSASSSGSSRSRPRRASWPTVATSGARRASPGRVRGAAVPERDAGRGLTGGRMARGRALCRPDPSRRRYCAGGTRVRRMRHPDPVPSAGPAPGRGEGPGPRAVRPLTTSAQWLPRARHLSLKSAERDDPSCVVIVTL